MLIKLTYIIGFSLVAFLLSFILYPAYIRFLQKIKAGKQIREATVTWEESSIFRELHAHKWWTPTMWWWVMLIVVLLLVGLSIIIQDAWYINNSLLTRQETYMPLFAFFSMWILGLIDDILNIKWKSAIKGLSASIKFVWMFWFSAFISYWFYWKLGIDYINFWPLGWEVSIWLFMPILMFFFTVVIVNAINIADGLDGLVWWLSLIILSVLWVITFVTHWYLATTIIGVILWCMLAFLWFNINPAKIFMGDSWALALWWIISALVYLININVWIIIPFIILMTLFWIEFWSSFLQIFWKKYFKRKLFAMAPFHHLLEHRGYKEHSIVMKFWLLQWVLWAVVLLWILYQFFG